MGFLRSGTECEGGWIMGYLKRVYHRASEGVGEKVFLFSVYMVELFWEKILRVAKLDTDIEYAPSAAKLNMLRLK